MGPRALGLQRAHGILLGSFGSSLTRTPAIASTRTSVEGGPAFLVRSFSEPDWSSQHKKCHRGSSLN